MLCFALFVAYVAHASLSAAADVTSIGTTPTTKWEPSSVATDGYACFLSHYKAQAGSDARYLADMLTRMLNGTPVFIDSSELSDLRTARAHDASPRPCTSPPASLRVLPCLRASCLVSPAS